MAYNKPIIIAGNGIRLSNTIQEFKTFIGTYNIPFVTSFLAKDITKTDHPLNMGVIGIRGNKWANKIVGEADLIIALGTRLCRGMIGYNNEILNKTAYKIVIDIDKNEHKKTFVKINKLLNIDLKYFFSSKLIDDLIFSNILDSYNSYYNWIQQCNQYKEKYKITFNDYPDGIDVYKFIDTLSTCLNDNSTVIADAGTAYFVTPQALRLIGENQRYITSGAQADMGFALPASIGVSIASKRDVICITGDGSFQLNIQELQTIVHNKLPIKIFVLNNNGYLTIRNTQDKFFEGRHIGTDSTCGISFPDLKKISYAYDIKYINIDKIKLNTASIKNILSQNNPVICEVMCSPAQKLLKSQ